MKRVIELKHVGPKAQVRQLIEALIDRVAEKLQHLAADAVSFHAMFDANGTQTVYRMSVTCHLPGHHTVAAHEESRDSGEAIRKAFAELERQLEKPLAVLHRDYLKRRSAHQRQAVEARFESRA